MSRIETLNKYIEENRASSEVLHGINNILQGMPIVEQLSIHSLLTPQALKLLFEYREELQLNDGAKEHVVWWYFCEKFRDCSVIESEELLSAVIEAYKDNRYVALESLIITLINNESLTMEQIEKIKEVFNLNALTKAIAIYRTKIKIRNKELLNLNETAELIDLNALEVLELAIKANVISKEGLELFECPENGALHKKRKLRLFQMAQAQLQNAQK